VCVLGWHRTQLVPLRAVCPDGRVDVSVKCAYLQSNRGTAREFSSGAAVPGPIGMLMGLLHHVESVADAMAALD
jgi:hypothetical protein